MSLVQTISMLFDAPKAAIGELILDVAISEMHTLQARATEHPVESGCSIIDHIQLLPDSIQLDGIISNTPTAFLGTPFFDSGNYADEAFRQLEELMKSRLPRSRLMTKMGLSACCATWVDRQSQKKGCHKLQMAVSLFV